MFWRSFLRLFVATWLHVHVETSALNSVCEHETCDEADDFRLMSPIPSATWVRSRNLLASDCADSCEPGVSVCLVTRHPCMRRHVAWTKLSWAIQLAAVTCFPHVQTVSRGSWSAPGRNTPCGGHLQHAFSSSSFTTMSSLSLFGLWALAEAFTTAHHTSDSQVEI